MIQCPRALRHVAAASVLVVLAACAGRPAREPAPTLRVMTYNVFAGNDLSRRSNLTRVAALVDSLRIDVLFVQEVDRNTARSGGTDQAATMATLTGMHAAFGRAMDFDGGEYGIAILSRWSILQSRVLPLDDPAVVPTEPRIALHAVIARHDRLLHLLNTHLDHRRDPAARRAQADRLLRFVVDSIRDLPLVAAGDMNAPPDAPELRALLSALGDAWPRCGSGAGHTFRSDRPDRRIDYVLLRGVTCTRAEVPAVMLSDHLPVVVDVIMHDRS